MKPEASPVKFFQGEKLSGGENLSRLENRLRDIARATPAGKLALAFSGGLDSRFLAHMILRAGLPAIALHVHGPHVPAREHAYALDWAGRAGLPLTVLALDPLSLPELAENPKDRCYHCKKSVFTALREAAQDLPLLDGTNASDLGVYRPGIRALAELAVLSPLAETGVAKSDIKAAASLTGLENPEQTAQPCLLTRFDYGARLAASTLIAVDRAEEAVEAALLDAGMPQTPFRLRYETADAPALHVGMPVIPALLAGKLAAILAASGFPHIPLRAMPDISGWFDRK